MPPAYLLKMAIGKMLVATRVMCQRSQAKFFACAHTHHLPWVPSSAHYPWACQCPGITTTHGTRWTPLPLPLGSYARTPLLPSLGATCGRGCRLWGVVRRSVTHYMSPSHQLLAGMQVFVPVAIFNIYR